MLAVSCSGWWKSLHLISVAAEKCCLLCVFCHEQFSQTDKKTSSNMTLLKNQKKKLHESNEHTFHLIWSVQTPLKDEGGCNFWFIVCSRYCESNSTKNFIHSHFFLSVIIFHFLLLFIIKWQISYWKYITIFTVKFI